MSTQTEIEFDGTPMQIGRETFIVPALSLGAVRRLLTKIQQLGDTSQGMDGVISSAIEVCGAALRRNYPEMTDDRLAELMDLSNMNKVVAAVLTQSGLAKTTDDEDVAGNAPAGSDSTS